MTDLVNVDMMEQPRLSEALERMRPKFAAIPTDKLLQIIVDPIAAAATAQGALPEIMTLRGRIVTDVPKFDVTNLDELEMYTLALIHAQSHHLMATNPPEALAALAEEATKLRELLLSDATALGKRGFINPTALHELKGPIGFRNVASDILALAVLLRSNWAKISSKTGVTEAELTRAELIGQRMIRAIGLREQSPTTVAATALERQQAYTLFVNAYDQVRRAVTFLRWESGDADDIAPSLYSGRASRKKHEIEVAQPSTPTTAPATLVTGTATTAPATVTPAARPTTGLPGADPFAS